MSIAARKCRDNLVNLRERIDDHLEDICKMFTQRPKITIIVRTPWLEAEGKDGDVILSDDDFDLAIAAINRLRGRPPVAQCVTCGAETEYCCADCMIDKRVRVYVCGRSECRDKHEENGCTKVGI
jgi:hypothetical protein